MALKSGPTWLPQEQMKVTQPAQAQLLHPAEKLAFVLAHRLSDILRIRICDVFMILNAQGNALDNVSTIALMMTSTKTRDTIGQYAVHLPPKGIADAIVREAFLKAQRTNSSFLFLPIRNPGISDDLLASVITKEEQRIRSVPDIRSLRRGALSTLSVAGFDFETMKLLSKHTHQDTLEVYLGAGLLDFSIRQKQMKMISTIEQAISSKQPLPEIVPAEAFFNGNSSMNL